MLLANGHPHAWSYRLATVTDEAAIVMRRENARVASEVIGVRAAATSVMSGDSENFNKFIDKLMGV